mmetsp:Transcript_24391/g.54963  ORF Transcript_24391/g.54963 Transcript_24391/m.54963 type:complete len:80 (-) Transcript_24391:282-521(-)
MSKMIKKEQQDQVQQRSQITMTRKMLECFLLPRVCFRGHAAAALASVGARRGGADVYNFAWLPSMQIWTLAQYSTTANR